MRARAALLLLALTISLAPTTAADPADCGPGIQPRGGAPAGDAPLVWKDLNDLSTFTATAYFLDLGVHCGAAYGTMTIDGQPAPQEQVTWGRGRALDEYQVRFVASHDPTHARYHAPGWHRVVATVWERCDSDSFGYCLPGPGHVDQQTTSWSYFVAPWNASYGFPDDLNWNWGALNQVEANGTDLRFHPAEEGMIVDASVARANVHFDRWSGDGFTMDLVPGSPPDPRHESVFPWIESLPQGSPTVGLSAGTRVHGTLTVAGVAIPFDAPLGVGLP